MILKGGNSGLVDDVYFLTATNSATFNSARVVANLNTYYNLFVNEILDSQDDWDFEGQIALANLFANQSDYVFPTDILKAKRLEISDGTNWYNAEQIDINEYRNLALGTSADVNNHFTSSAPAFSAFDNSIYLYPVPDAAVNSGLRLWYSDSVVELSGDGSSATATMEPVFNESYHRGLSYGVAKDWFQKTGDEKMAAIMEKEMEKIIARMRLFYSNRLPDREYRLKPLIDNFS